VTTTIEWDKPVFLKKLRLRLGLSRPKLAAAAGLTADDINNLERGLSHITPQYGVAVYAVLAGQDVTSETQASAALKAAMHLYHDQLKQELEEKERIREELPAQIQDIKKQLKMLEKIAQSA